ncbi:uncharacterized protein LOC144650130 [Oculina patagonica]
MVFRQTMKLTWMMLMTCVITISVIIPVVTGENSCYEQDWQISASGPGWTNCSKGRYLNGLWRENDADFSGPDGIDNIKKGRCCISPPEYKNNTQVCLKVDWKSSLNRNHHWASCPEGYFLQGVYHSSGTSLSNIEQALCCRPRNFQNMNMDCHIESVMTSLDKRGWSKCWGDLYYMAGVYRGDCDNLYCIEMIKCCKMMPLGTHDGIRSADMEVLGHWLLNGGDELVRSNSLPSFTKGRCPNSKAIIFNQTNSFATTPIIILNDRSFTIVFWIRQTKWVRDQIGAIYGDWYDPWQFLLSTKNHRITLHRHQSGNEEWWSLESNNVNLDTWTHVAVTWDHVTGSVFIYADGKEIGYRSYTSGGTFFQPTWRRYQIGNDGHTDNHQFHGSVMNLYVFGTALSLDQINRLRGFPVIVNTTRKVTGGVVVVAWEPPLDGTCSMIVGYTVYYREVMSLERKGEWHSVIVDRNVTSYTLRVNCGKEYDVAVTSRSGNKENNLSDSKIWNFKTAGGVSVVVNTTRKVTGRIVVVAWEPPLDGACPIVGYTVYYREVMSLERKGGWHSVTLNRNMTSYTLFVNCGKEYDVAVTSRSGNKESNLGDSKIWNFKTERGDNDCHEVDWQMNLSKPGWSNCSCPGSYLTGLWRESYDVFSSKDGIDNIKRGRCCFPPQEYKDDKSVCQTVNWKTSLSRNNQWASCPDGHFLQGVYRSNDTRLHNIEQASCCKPRNFESMYKNMDCYDENVGILLDKKGWSTCMRDWYYMVGMYRGGCDQLHCIEIVKCCRMRPPDMTVLGHWLLNGEDELLRFDNSLPYFTEGRCSGSKAAFFNQTNSFAITPVINLNGRSFTIACWIKQTSWVLDHLGAIYSDWYDQESQFLLSTKNHKIIFHRHQDSSEEEWWSLESNRVNLTTWTHVAVTWDHVTGKVFIYANGKEIGYRSYSSGAKFYKGTGKWYQIGKDRHWNNHQFLGSLMDLYVFGTALSLDEINRLRGVPVIANTTKVVPGGTVVVAWEPPLEGACPVEKYTVYYREVGPSSKWHLASVSRNTTSYTLRLNCGSEYDVGVTSVSGYGESSLNKSKIWNFKTSGGVPSPPAITNKETETLRCDVNLTWNPPEDNGCQLTMYSIYYQQIQPRETGTPWYQVNVTKIMRTRFTISLACGRQYKVEMSAWNGLGESDRSRPWIIKTISDSDKNDVRDSKLVKSSESETGNLLSVPQLAGLIAGLGVLMIIIFMVILSLLRRARKKKQLAHNIRPRRSKSMIIPLRRWEVLPEQVVFDKEIGCGAFGKVFKGTFKESPGIEVFYEPRSQTVDFQAGRTVAIKVLGDRTDEEAKSQFLDEIELMKAIGLHKNVLSMLGCWVSSDPIFLVLEYVPYGDLLHWLRNKRIQKNYQKNYDDGGNHSTLVTNDVHVSSDDESKALLTGNDEERKELANRDKPKDDLACCSTLNSEGVTGENAVVEAKPEVDGRVLNHYEKEPTYLQNGSNGNMQREEDFSAKDLLSFAWQIARGMDFLSSNGFVHRDLAARNILLGDDKVVKISDFGLMRQTHENVYQLKKGKKIPVKWMAPEALYNSEYTTKSDVWSFGILLWELSTMGGNPYPGINNKELYNLLKTGYRMEKPETCSDKLYQLMLNCWREDPSDRPTFESATRSLEKMLQEDTPYLDLETLDESKSCYCNDNLSDDDIPV